MSIDVNAVSRIDSEAGLFDFLRSELGWPLADSPETYDFYADEMGLNGGDSGRIGRVRQIVNFQTGQPWGVFLVEHIGGLSRKALRAVLRGLSETRRDRDAALPAWKAGHLLFLCTPDYREVSFAHFRGETHTRATLSIFGWERDKTGLRTLCDYNLPALRYPEDPSDTGGWLEGWASAFDVEKVTQRFYEAYERIFHQAEERIGGVRGDRRLFTQRLFNRLMFIHFLSKKGWLRFDGRTDYLNALWEGRDPEENFYRYHLLPLFFCGLNNVQARDLTLNSPTLAALIGEVPYLNGGLFEKTESDEAGESVPDEIFPCVFQELFFRFNFTVHESTSQDIEVAVDPEMLGKVFEELVTQGERHSTGSYYTPRPVVEFMCREALKGYLGGCEDLVGGRDAESVTVPQARQLLAKLKAVKVVDPACGSGAYLLGMLHELHALARLLDTRAQEASARDDYKRKLDIIQGNLYGVDKEEFAVNIARLRLWLSLAVEYEGDDPQPLPNLDFKIERQDSLLAPDPRGGLQPDMFRQQQIEEFESLKARYADPYCAGDKPDLKKRIGEQKAAIARWLNPGPREGGFDWRVEFSEVFQGGGFDIALANPPYVRQELIKELKPALKALYPAVYTGTADLYCYFYARALQLLKPGGMLAFISSNKWFRASYGEKLRRLMAESCLIHSITDFGDLPVFQSATAYPMIFIAEKADRDELTGSPSPDAGQTRRSAPTETPTLFTQVKSLAPPYPDVLAVVRQEGLRLPPDAFDGADWTLADSASADRLRKMEKAGIPLGQYVQGQIYYGVKTGFNAAFVIDGAKREELIRQDAKSAEIIKPLAMGRDIKKWSIDYPDKWLIVTRIGVDIERYPAIFAHLKQWQKELEKRWDKGNHWWELRACDYYEVFDKPKIVYQEIATYQAFALDLTGAFMNNKVFMIPSYDLYLIAILNSGPVWHYLHDICSKLSGGALAMQTPYISKIPIPDASPSDRAAVAALARKCLDAKGAGCEAWEAEMDERVCGLYGL